MPKPHYPQHQNNHNNNVVIERPKRPTGRTNIASCVVATIFILFILIISLILYFTLFKPTNPILTITAIQLPSFSIQNNTLSFTFSQYSKVDNPNRSSFSHYDSSLQLLYGETQLGFMFIPAGAIQARRTQYMAATFAVRSFPLGRDTKNQPESGIDNSNVENQSRRAQASQTVHYNDNNINMGGALPAVGGYGGLPVGPTIELESKMVMEGRVRVLRVFTHHVQAKAGCMVVISVTDGSVLGFHC